MHPEAVIPMKGSVDAACFDVVATEIEHNDKYVTVKLGFATAIPTGYKGVIVPRSSFTQKGWVMQNSPGQIDSDYRGEWMIKFERVPNTTSVELGNEWIDVPMSFPYNEGDRVAQIYFEQILPVTFTGVLSVDETERGTGGFGSTGQAQFEPTKAKV